MLALINCEWFCLAFAIIVDHVRTRGALGDFHIKQGQLFFDLQVLQNVLLGNHFQ